MIVLLTGIPGVGKSTVAKLLSARHGGMVSVISFGQLLYELVVGREGPLNYAEFRQRATKYVTRQDIATAASMIESSRYANTSSTWLLVDSHAVAKEWFGWQAHPDDPDTLRRFSYDMIVHLEATPSEVLKRIAPSSEGRLATEKRDFEVLSHIQLAISAYYAGTLGCPLNIVDANVDIERVTDAVERLLGIANAT